MDINEAHAEAYARGELPMYTIYYSPADHPGKFVMRMHLNKSGPTSVSVVADTLKETREAVPVGLMCWTRAPSDPPQVVETWF